MDPTRPTAMATVPVGEVATVGEEMAAVEIDGPLRTKMACAAFAWRPLPACG